MTPHEKRAVRLHQKAVQDALKFFESCPEYPSVQVQLHAELNSLDQNTRDPSKTNEQRLELVLQIFDVRARAFIRLVKDMPSQKAFITLLEDWVPWAWFEYAGYSLDSVLINGRHPDVQALLNKYAHWRAEGYRRLAKEPASEVVPSLSNRQETPEEKMAKVLTAESLGVEEIKANRRDLLAEYKTATENPSNKQLYEAKNSGIHKPDFYAWLNGKLSSESAMSINFERFLRLKKPPIPRRPKG